MKRLSGLLLFVLLARPLAALDAGELERVFAGKEPRETASFLLVLRDRADLSGAASIADRLERRRFVFEALRARADASQRRLVRRLAQAGVRYRSFFLVNMIEVEGDRALAEELSGAGEVAAIAPNRPSTLRGVPPGGAEVSPLSASAVEPSLSHIGAPTVWTSGYTGQGVVVGIADTGVAWEHPALKNRYRGFDGTSASHDYNWRDAIHGVTGNPCGSDTTAPCDDQGHGTHVTGTAVGTDGGENQIGVAPGARWIGCRNMDRNVGTPARYAECFEFFLAPTDLAGGNPRPDLGADVINNSWGCPESEGCTDPNVLRGVIENVRAAGIFVAVSAGNSGSGCSSIDTVPAFYEASFTVGASSLFDTIANFSSRGPVTVDGSGRSKPDVVAPGLNIRSAMPGDGYIRSSGTSMASPHVSGVVALVWSAAPWLTGQVAPTEEILRATAVRLTSDQSCGAIIGSQIPNSVFGWGRVDAAAAVSAALATGTPPAPAPRIPATRSRSQSRTIAPRN
jgi:serine protease AprX